MTTETEPVDASRGAHLPMALTRTGYFALHWLEMCVVMCAGGVALLSVLLSLIVPRFGYPDLRLQFPELSTLILTLWLAALMIFWMRFRGHDWRSTLEMASTSIIAFPLILGGTGLGLLPRTGIFGLECGLACVFMVVPMLLRRDHYTGPHHAHVDAGHTEHHHHADM